jgi:hypothetical protein
MTTQSAQMRRARKPRTFTASLIRRSPRSAPGSRCATGVVALSGWGWAGGRWGIRPHRTGGRSRLPATVVSASCGGCADHAADQAEDQVHRPSVRAGSARRVLRRGSCGRPRRGPTHGGCSRPSSPLDHIDQVDRFETTISVEDGSAEPVRAYTELIGPCAPQPYRLP